MIGTDARSPMTVQSLRSAQVDQRDQCQNPCLKGRFSSDPLAKRRTTSRRGVSSGTARPLPPAQRGPPIRTSSGAPIPRIGRVVRCSRGPPEVIRRARRRGPSFRPRLKAARPTRSATLATGPTAPPSSTQVLRPQPKGHTRRGSIQTSHVRLGLFGPPPFDSSHCGLESMSTPRHAGGPHRFGRRTAGAVAHRLPRRADW